ncbi:hypothetical protein O181_066414 [Austropuccinia psidii MF-1]|uniref:Uncharacterized protein n=1 Tax=Austropuccinia psidii MF-1 TaxID=1389203 RepID=A0A9Q3ETF2_9BASI|nr:hypothetical protein [Austropuccinia psidii MF-1]
MGFKCQKQTPPNPPQQDSPVPHIPHKKALRQLTPGPSGTDEPSQYDELRIPGRSQSPKSQLPTHEDGSTCEPEPEVAPKQSKEDPLCNIPISFFSCYQHSLTTPSKHIQLVPLPLPPSSSLTIRPSLPPSTPTPVPSPEIPLISPKSPTAYSPHSHNEVLEEFTHLGLTLMIPQEIIH